jgi:hypothetical protein
MADIAERISEAKKKVESLKKDVTKARKDKLEGYEGLRELVKGRAPALGEFYFTQHSIHANIH